jgi:uncharacterized protein with PQ loop repeat
MNLTTTIIGFLAGVGTTVSFTPQVVTLSSVSLPEEIEGVSLNMFIIHLTGVLLWIVYGFLVKDWILTFFNIVVSALVLYCLYRVVKIRSSPSSSPFPQNIKEFFSPSPEREEKNSSNCIEMETMSINNDHPTLKSYI